MYQVVCIFRLSGLHLSAGSGQAEKISHLGCTRVWGAIFSLNFKNMEAQKVFLCMIFGLGGHVHDPQIHLFLILETTNYSKRYKNSQIMFENTILATCKTKIEDAENACFGMF